MATLREEKPKSFSDILEILEKHQKGRENPLWFRGCKKTTYRLEPTLFRHPTKNTIKECIELENEMITRFKQRSIPFRDRDLSDNWDTLFFMQHYSVPTRLLDWTENPLVALYFAVMSAEYEYNNQGQRKYKNISSIWILDPVAWNQHSLDRQSFEGGILSHEDTKLGPYEPNNIEEGSGNLPLAIYGTHNSPRIVAQRGVFTIFGDIADPMEKLYLDKLYPDKCLIKVKLNKSVIPKIRESLFKYGITESVVFPDLEGFAKEIKRTFGFKE